MKKVILILFLFSACSSPNKLLKKAEKLIAEAEAKGATWHSDTVYKEIPIITPKIQFDTIVKTVPGDTVFIVKNNVKVKIVKLKGDSTFVDVLIPADTVIKEVPVTVTKIIEAEPKYDWYVWLIIGFAAGALLTIVIVLRRS